MIALRQLRIGTWKTTSGLRLRVIHPAVRHDPQPRVDPTAVERAARRDRMDQRRDHLRIDGERMGYGLTRQH